MKNLALIAFFAATTAMAGVCDRIMLNPGQNTIIEQYDCASSDGTAHLCVSKVKSEYGNTYFSIWGQSAKGLLGLILNEAKTDNEEELMIDAIMASNYFSPINSRGASSRHEITLKRDSGEFHYLGSSKKVFRSSWVKELEIEAQCLKL